MFRVNCIEILYKAHLTTLSLLAFISNVLCVLNQLNAIGDRHLVLPGRIVSLRESNSHPACFCRKPVMRFGSKGGLSVVQCSSDPDLKSREKQHSLWYFYKRYSVSTEDDVFIYEIKYCPWTTTYYTKKLFWKSVISKTR